MWEPGDSLALTILVSAVILAAALWPGVTYSVATDEMDYVVNRYTGEVRACRQFGCAGPLPVQTIDR